MLGSILQRLRGRVQLGIYNHAEDTNGDSYRAAVEDLIQGHDLIN